MSVLYKPGSLVRLRGREWVVESSSDTLLAVRPLGGSAEDVQLVLPDMETTPVEEASFPLPDKTRPGPFHSALLLRDALLMKCRAGAGPFRGFGGINIELRAYQLVPLLMALKQQTVRLLIADDVGIGKTIEAALIVRELLDRAEIERFAVLCPPHLVEQWTAELKNRFHIDAAAITASNINRLERDVPRGLTVFQYHTAFVISLDYIKSDAHRQFFLSNAPEMILVDEAHTCTSVGQGRQLRFELLQSLCEDTNRHLLMLTATPHSGNETGFYNLLSLLRPDFAGLASGENKTLRAELGNYFVQRRRVDIDEWNDASLFPRRKTKEATYELSGIWETFFEKTRAYCLRLAEEAERKKAKESHVIWYAILALLRCVSSSPDAARRALTTHLEGSESEMEALICDERISDGAGDELVLTDEEPAAGLREHGDVLQSLIDETDRLKGIQNDPKLACLVKEVEYLISAKQRFKPIVFCRYIATAHYVAEQLREHFKNTESVRVACITGEITSDEREEQIDALISEADIPVLVSTDCLSEGVNLQDGFDAIIHYDLAWNPTRHEQREGRVDRFGQKSAEVRCIMLYGENNPVDGLIFNVILKKAQAIKQTLGILVPIPEDERKIQTAIVKAALMKKSASKQPPQSEFDFGDSDDGAYLQTISAQWQDAMEKESKNRTIFAQRRLKPQDVLPEWKKQADVLGNQDDVSRFVRNTLHIAGAPLEPVKDSYKFLPEHLPEALQKRITGAGFEKPFRIDFTYPPEKSALFLHRSHPIVSILADYILENTLESKQNENVQRSFASRCGVYETDAVTQVTTICLIRLRHKIEITHNGAKSRRQKSIVAEEAMLLGFEGRTTVTQLPEECVKTLLDQSPGANLEKTVIERELDTSLAWFRNSGAVFEKIAVEKAAALLADHRRVRDASDDVGQFNVQPSLPVDLIGLYVLLPAEL
jgi:ERCC4-related helicase